MFEAKVPAVETPLTSKGFQVDLGHPLGDDIEGNFKSANACKMQVQDMSSMLGLDGDSSFPPAPRRYCRLEEAAWSEA